MKINDWVMNFREYGELTATVPCSMYSVLYAHGKIPHPYEKCNSQILGALSEQDCEFSAQFQVKEKDLENQNAILRFEGLDTICEIRLNGIVLGNAKNFHRTYEFSCKELLKIGKNEICLHFSSPTKFMKEQQDASPLWTDGNTIQGAAHLRKPFYMSGWDWAPTLPDMGIFRPVEILFFDDRIESFFIEQHHSSDKVVLRLKSSNNYSKNKILYKVSYEGNLLHETTVNNGEAEIEIFDPKLWWVRGYGEQPLYNVETYLIDESGKILDSKTKRIGLRTLTVSTQFDEIGREFCFVINGVKIFAMGANYVPEESILPWVTPERTQALLTSCVEANFNCVRVWGGGYYPDETFWDFCDEHGLIVWQDFMIACMDVRMGGELEHEYIEEFIENVNRLKHHASLGLICGNNEMEWLRNGHMSDIEKADYLKLYEDHFPTIMKKIAPNVFYWQASPSSVGNFDSPNDPLRGDTHFWAVFNGGADFDCYRQYTFRFCSEFGFEGFPSVKTIQSVVDKDNLNPLSSQVEWHQKKIQGTQKIISYAANHYRYAYNFEDFTYVSALNQANAIKFGVEHFRANRGVSMGSIYWQLNDCWPVVSWSSLDYYGRWKALHYFAKKFYSPLLLGVRLSDTKAIFNISNETRKSFIGNIVWEIKRNDLLIIEEGNVSVESDILSACDVFELDCISKLAGQRDSCFLTAKLYAHDGNIVSKQTVLFVRSKDYTYQQMDVRYTIKEKSKGVYALRLQTNSFVQGVYVDFHSFDAKMSDNWFDITDEDGYEVEIFTDKTKEEIENNIRFQCVNDVGCEQKSRFILRKDGEN